MIKTFIICLGLFVMCVVSFLPTVSLKEDTIRDGLTAIALNIFLGTLLILIKMGGLK